MKRFLNISLVLFFFLAHAMADCVSLPYTESFKSSLGQFQIVDLTTDDMAAVWSFNSYGYAMASGYDANKVRHATESYLLSPCIDVPATGTTTLSFSHAHRYASNATDEMSLYVSADYTSTMELATWAKLTIPTYASGTDWTWVNSGNIDLTAYAGQSVTLAFRYKSTTTSTPTWEIKNLSVTNQSDSTGTVTEPENPFPVGMPVLGRGELLVCGQNTRYYFVEALDASPGPDSATVGYLERKTKKMVQVFRFLNADIFALNEIEVNDSVLSYLCAAMNADAGQDLYGFVKDGLTGTSTSDIKSGYMYRKDKVKPYGSNTAGSGTKQGAYFYRMRIQAFEELSSGERFVLSMNHFKAKVNSDDQGAAQRLTNATNLTKALAAVKTDPDILVMGDLNCTTDEEPVQYLINNAGLTEILEQYNSSAYTYYYSGNQLIDHVLANNSMKAQITGADVFHINTGTRKNSSWWYSDHDPYLVSINLNSTTSLDDVATVPHRAQKYMINGQLLIVVDDCIYTATGVRVE